MPEQGHRTGLSDHPGVFVGRERELGELRSAFDDAVSGNGRLVMVVGEPGIGKTALCKELVRYAQEQGGTTLIGHCYEEGSLSLPYLPFVQAMRSYVVSRSEDDLRADLGDSASHIARIMPEIQDKLGVEPGAPIDPEEDRYRLLNGVTTFLINASKSRPLAIVLEDLHDADSGTLEMLTYLSGFLSETNALVVGTYRDVEVDRAHPLASALVELRRASTFARVPLRGLGLEDVRRMMTDVSGESITEHLAVTVHDQTEGNPLFVQEVARYLREEQVLATGDSEVELRVPEGVRDVIGKRLSRLSKECNQMLAVASVIGREFELDILLDVSSLSEDDLYTQLEEAQGASVVEESSGLRGGLSYRFSHAMIRETLYEEIFAPLRIRLHKRVGLAVEGAYAGQLEQHAAGLAGHFANSSSEEDLTRALEYSEMAARHAQSVYSYGEAARLLEQALRMQQLLDLNDTAKRCDLLVEFGNALTLAGEPRRTFEVVAEEAFALAETECDAVRASGSCQLALSALMHHGRGSTALSPEFRMWVDRADKYAMPDTKDRVAVDYFASSALRQEGKLAEARAMTLRGFELAERLDEPDLVSRGAFMFLSRPCAARYQTERLRTAQGFGDRSVEGETGRLDRHSSGLVLLAWGDRDGAEDVWRDMLDRAKQSKDPYLPMARLELDNHSYTLDGRLDAVVEAGRLRIEKAQELGSAVGEQALVNHDVWRPLMYLGRTQEALAPWQAESLEFHLWGPVALAYSGRQPEAVEALHRSVRELGITPEDDDVPAEYLAVLLEAAVLVQEPEVVGLLAAKLTELSQMSTFVVPISTTPARHLGDASALLAKPGEARVYYEQALEASGKIRFRPEIALTRHALAEVLLDHYPDEREDAVEHLDFAITELRDMKMQPAMERALGLQAGLDEHPVAKPAYPDGLTEREVGVLRLIIAGATNQEIGDALFITTNTVAKHVRNILTKSNTDNRTGAAAYAIRLGLAED